MVPAQHKRWGLLKEHPDYLGVASRSTSSTLQGRRGAKVNVPREPLRSSKLIDGTVWDGKNPTRYADGFKISG